jgi:hypothetical protein
MGIRPLKRHHGAFERVRLRVIEDRERVMRREWRREQ